MGGPWGMAWSTFFVLLIVLLGPIIAIIISVAGYFEKVYKLKD
jgi:hypothetical protein